MKDSSFHGDAGRIITAGLGRPPEAIFASLDRMPLSAASVQVHHYLFSNELNSPSHGPEGA